MVFIDHDEAVWSNKVSQRHVAIGVTSALDLYSAVRVSGSVWSIKVSVECGHTMKLYLCLLDEPECFAVCVHLSKPLLLFNSSSTGLVVLRIN